MWPGAGAGAGKAGLIPGRAMESLWRLERFDAFPKTLEDFRVKTCGGALSERRGAGERQARAEACGGGRPLGSLRSAAGLTAVLVSPAVTVVSGLIMVVLFFSELQYYLTKEVSSGGGGRASRRVWLVPAVPRRRGGLAAAVPRSPAPPAGRPGSSFTRRGSAGGFVSPSLPESRCRRGCLVASCDECLKACSAACAGHRHGKESDGGPPPRATAALRFPKEELL